MKLVLTLALTLIVGASGCASTERIKIEEKGAETDTARIRAGIDIIGYATSDRQQHSFVGTVRLLDDGLWHFTPHGYGSAPFTLRQDQVSWLSTVKTTPQSGAAAIVVTIAALSVGIFLISLSRALAHW